MFCRVVWYMPLSLLLVLVSQADVRAQASFESLLRRLPNTANAVMVVNIEQIRRSPFAEKVASQDELSQAVEDRVTAIPPSAKRFVLGMQLDLEHWVPEWRAALMEVERAPAADAIAKNLNGKVETLGDMPLIWSPLDLFVIQFEPTLIGVMTPANRQAVGRWSREGKSSSGSLSPYLQKSGSFSDTAGTDVILALDLQDVIPASQAKLRLAKSNFVKGKNLDLDAVGKILASAQGVRLGIRIKETPYAKLVVDFSENPSSLAPIAGDLIREVLANNGMLIDDLAKWKSSTTSSTIGLEGEMSIESLRLLASLIEVPREALQSVETAQRKPQVSNASSASLKGQASLQQFRTLERYLKDLKLQHKESLTLGQSAIFIDSTARRIDELPILNVDEDLVKFCSQVSRDLRNMANAFRQSGIRTSTRQAQVYSSGYVSGYGNGGYNGFYGEYYGEGYVAGEHRRAKVEERASAVTNVQQAGIQITNALAELRRALTQRYQIEF